MRLSACPQVHEGIYSAGQKNCDHQSHTAETARSAAHWAVEGWIKKLTRTQHDIRTDPVGPKRSVPATLWQHSYLCAL
jgi:hypothetical protein